MESEGIAMAVISAFIMVISFIFTIIYILVNKDGLIKDIQWSNMHNYIPGRHIIVDYNNNGSGTYGTLPMDKHGNYNPSLANHREMQNGNYSLGGKMVNSMSTPQRGQSIEKIPMNIGAGQVNGMVAFQHEALNVPTEVNMIRRPPTMPTSKALMQRDMAVEGIKYS